MFRSAKHIYAQVIDDTRGTTLVAASSLSKILLEQAAAASEGSETADAGGDKGKAPKRPARSAGKKTIEARRVGALLAERCKEHNVHRVVFDRNGYLYHGRVRALAEAARKAGLTF